MCLLLALYIRLTRLIERIALVYICVHISVDKVFSETILK